MRLFKTTPKRKDDASCERSFVYEYGRSENCENTNSFTYRELMNAWTNTLEGKSNAILGRNKIKSKTRKPRR